MTANSKKAVKKDITMYMNATKRAVKTGNVNAARNYGTILATLAFSLIGR